MLAPAHAQDCGEEARRDPRLRVLRRAVLVKGAGQGSSSCLILDISAGGARVQFSDDEAISEQGVTLVDARTGFLHEATVVWRSGPFAGVAFSSTCTLEAYGSSGGAGASALRVLAVDDDATNRFVLEKALNGLHANLVFAVNGEEAVAAFQEGEFDIVLMDLRMPRMDGLEAIRRIRAFEAERGTGRTPIILVTAHTEASDVAAACAAGADAHISKPVNSEALLSGVRRLAVQAHQEAA